MSIVPLLFSNWWEDFNQPHRIFDQDFGLGLQPEQLLSPHVLERYVIPHERRNRNPLHYYRPCAELMRNAGTSTVKSDKNKFQVILDVKQFKPEEINVKVVDKCVVVEAKHEEQADEHGWISRQFIRRYMIPEQCDIAEVKSSLSSDGVLTISAPKKNLAVEGERAIKIEQTGQPAIREDCTKNDCSKDCKEDDKTKKIEKK